MTNRWQTRWSLVAISLLLFGGLPTLTGQPLDRPLTVLLVPSDGGTEDGTRADFAPLFAALTRQTGYAFKIRVGQSYAAVIEAMANQQADLAYFGTVSFLTARERGPVELLAISVIDGGFFYYSGFFTRADSGITSLSDLAGRSLILSDPRSSSGFVYPLAWLEKSALDPLRDPARIILSGSHANTLTALAEGRGDVAAAPFESYVRAVRNGVIDPRTIRIVAKSDPIPNPPIAVNATLPPEVRTTLRQALDEIHRAPGVEPGMIRGHAGKIVDRYEADVEDALFDLARTNMALIDDAYRAAVLAKAGER